MKSIFNALLASYLFLNGLLVSSLVSSVVGNEPLEEEIEKIFASYNFVYDYMNGGVALVAGIGVVLSILSSIAMFFRIKFSNYIFIIGVTLFNFSIIGNLNGVSVVTNSESVLEALIYALEGAIIVLSLFRDDLGFTMTKPDM